MPGSMLLMMISIGGILLLQPAANSSRQDRLDLCTKQEGDLALGRDLAWNSENALDLPAVGGLLERQRPEEGADRGKSEVIGSCACGTLVRQLVQEGHDQLGVEISDREPDGAVPVRACANFSSSRNVSRHQEEKRCRFELGTGLVRRHGNRPLDHPRCPARLASLGVVLVSQIQQALPGEWIGLVRASRTRCACCLQKSSSMPAHRT
jgi:hypothetical protein